MRKGRFTEGQIIFMIKEQEAAMVEVEPISREKNTAALAGDGGALRGVMGDHRPLERVDVTTRA